MSDNLPIGARISALFTHTPGGHTTPPDYETWTLGLSMSIRSLVIRRHGPQGVLLGLIILGPGFEVEFERGERDE